MFSFRCMIFLLITLFVHGTQGSTIIKVVTDTFHFVGDSIINADGGGGGNSKTVGDSVVIQPQNRTAYCAYGSFQRDHLENYDLIKESLLKNVLSLGNIDLFYVSTEPNNSHSKDFSKMAIKTMYYEAGYTHVTNFFNSFHDNYTSVLRKYYGVDEAPILMGGCLQDEYGSLSTGHAHCQFLDMYYCQSLIENYELDMGHKYDRVIMARNDIVYPGKHPSFRYLDTFDKDCWVPCENQDFGGYCDRYILCKRDKIDKLTHEYLAKLKRNVLPTILVAKMNAEKWLKYRLNGLCIGRLPHNLFYRVWKGDVSNCTDYDKTHELGQFCNKVKGVYPRIEARSFHKLMRESGYSMQIKPNVWKRNIDRWKSELIKVNQECGNKT